ncbi:hypothetical protein [Kitasatospora sp. NPDC004289]
MTAPARHTPAATPSPLPSAAESAAGASAVRFELTAQIAHWRTAIRGLADLDNFAAPAAWQSLERYLGLTLRRHLEGLVHGVSLELDALEADLRAVRDRPDLARVTARLNRFRRRFLQAETVLEFYGHAVHSRTTTRLAEILRACDVLARQAMVAPLRPLGIEPPPVLVYTGGGVGASILRARLGGWDGPSGVSPAAAVKLTRFNLFRPTSLLHEVGHQVAHLNGWSEELAGALRRGVPDPAVGELWAGWASEFGPDLLAFAHSGYGSVAALHDVVTGDDRKVFGYPLGDPHPIAWLRVLVGIELCVRHYGTGPWDTLRRAWVTAHPITAAPPALRPLLERSVAQLPRIAEIGMRAPMRAFGGRALAEVVDPARVSPSALASLERTAGTALLTSSHYLTTEGLRLLARSSLEVAVRPDRAARAATDCETWMRNLGRLVSAPRTGPS